MKKIEAFIRPERLGDVGRALEEKGFVSMTVTDVEGRGRQKGITLEWRASEYQVDLLPKIKLEIIADDKEWEKIVEIIREAAKTGEVGDGKIVVYPVEEIIRVRTGEKGLGAL
ncbi:MAG TPA: P-II family nitrogen regulator [Candidatus Subteraquimicrobiales bacterium]